MRKKRFVTSSQLPSIARWAKTIRKARNAMNTMSCDEKRNETRWVLCCAWNP
jgi:hypothetical protein